MDLKVCLMSQLFFPVSGGIERYTYDLSRSLAKLGAEVHVITLPCANRPRYEELEGVFVHRVPLGKSDYTALMGTIMMARTANRLFKAEGTDIIHGNIPHMSDAFLSKSKIKANFVETIHTIVDSEFMPLKNASFRSLSTSEKFLSLAFPLVKRVERGILKRADGMISVSKSSKVATMRSYRMDEGRIKVIYIGISTERFRSNPVQSKLIRDRMGVDDGPLLLYVGRLCARKRPELLIRALSSLRAKVRGAKLMIVGGQNEDYQRYLTQLASDLGVRDSVAFSGYVRDAELPNYYSACDVFLLTSSAEGLGLSVLEAMACGKPVVAPNLDAIPEVVESGESGFLFNNFGELVSSLASIVSDRSLKMKMGSYARKHVIENFSCEKMAKETVDYYEAIMKGGGRRSPNNPDRLV